MVFSLFLKCVSGVADTQAKDGIQKQTLNSKQTGHNTFLERLFRIHLQSSLFFFSRICAYRIQGFSERSKLNMPIAIDL